MSPDNLPDDGRINAHDSASLRRQITNQKREHTPHAFHVGRGGMERFNNLVPVLRSLPGRELSQWAELINEVCISHRYCLSCFCKAYAYLILITKDILPELHEFHLRRYQSVIKRRAHDQGRDFMIEVLDSLYQGTNPDADACRAWWNRVCENGLSS